MYKFIIIRTFAGERNHSKKMPELSEYQRERLELIEHKLKFVSEKPLVACITGSGIYINDLIEMAGGRPLFVTNAQEGYAVVVEQNPDVLIVLPEAGSALNAMSLIPELLNQPGFAEVKAIKNNRLYIIDHDVFTEGELSIVDKAELLAEIIYPKQFIFGYEGQGWIKFGL